MAQAFDPLASRGLSAQRLFSSYNGRLLLVVLLIGVLVLLAFGFLYYREWRYKRSIRRLAQLAREKQAQAQTVSPPGQTRPPLLKVTPSKSASVSYSRSGANPPGQPRPPAGSEAELPAPAQAQRTGLALSSQAGACEVYIDGAFVGHAPARVMVPQGVHLVEVRRPGRPDSAGQS